MTFVDIPAPSVRFTGPALRTQYFSIITIVNGLLLAAAIAVTIMYAVWSNSIAVSNYQIKSLKEELTRHNETYTSLMMKKAQFEDADIARDYAIRANMVQENSPLYLFEDGDVALRR